MTFIDFKKQNNYPIVILSILAIISFVFMVVLYNQTVNLNYSIGQIKNQITQSQAHTDEIQTQILSILNSSNASNEAKKMGLIVDNNPQYLQANSRWAFAFQ
jgi:cell division protein FtsL